MEYKRLEDLTKEEIKEQFEKQRIFQPDKVYSIMERLKQVPYLKNINLKNGEKLRLNRAEIGLILTADYTGDEILGGETIKDYYGVTMPTPEIRQNVKKIFDGLEKETGLRFSAYDGDKTKNGCSGVINLSDSERIDFRVEGN